MPNLPMRVSLTTSAADMQQTIASQSSRRAASAGSTARKWSSMNSMVAMTMSPRAMSARQRASAAASPPHSSAACTDESQARQIARAAACGARAAAPDRWLSIVTIDDAHAASASAAEVRFGIVERLDGDRWHAAFVRRSVRCCGAPCRERRRESCAVPSRRRRPRPRTSAAGGRVTAARQRPAVASAGAAWRRAQMRRRGAVVEFEIVRGTSPADALRAPSSADAPRCRRSRWRLRSPSAASSAPGNPARAPAPRSPRRECRGAWRCGAPSACRAPVRAAARATLASTSR